MVDEGAQIPAQEAVARLTPREREVLGMIADGLTNAEAAARLQLSVHAVKFHLAGIYRRLSVGNRTEAAATYYRAQAARISAEGLAD
jgi:DNA-binding CsgD family transcriptional regulator